MKVKHKHILFYFVLCIVTICLLFFSNIIFLDLFVNKESETVLEKVDNSLIIQEQGQVVCGSESYDTNSMKELYTLNARFYTEDVLQQNSDFLQESVDLIFNPISGGYYYTLKNIFPATNTSFSTHKMKDGFYRLAFNYNGEIFDTNAPYKVTKGVLTPFRGEEVKLDFKNAKKSDDTFAYCDVVESGNNFLFYSVAGVYEMSCNKQKIYMEIVGSNLNKSYILRQVLRKDFADVQNNAIYNYAGGQIALPKKIFYEGIYRIKLYVENDELYSMGEEWVFNATQSIKKTSGS